MSRAELDTFLAERLTCRVATGSQDGPHLTARRMAVTAYR
jgi:nitroimidazol reductase NimA-like FMN-containing flavoprotein (pyridoxamine 5'-phosphate oxidase superfamily)